MVEEKNALETLFPGVKVEGYVVKEWTFGQARRLMPTVSRIVGVVRAWYAERASEVDPANESVEAAMKRFPPEEILGELLPKLMDEAPEVLHVSLGIKPEEIEKMKFTQVSALFLGVLLENADYIKNFFGPGAKAAG